MTGRVDVLEFTVTLNNALAPSKYCRVYRTSAEARAFLRQYSGFRTLWYRKVGTLKWRALERFGYGH